MISCCCKCQCNIFQIFLPSEFFNLKKQFHEVFTSWLYYMLSYYVSFAWSWKSTNPEKTHDFRQTVNELFLDAIKHLISSTGERFKLLNLLAGGCRFEGWASETLLMNNRYLLSVPDPSIWLVISSCIIRWPIYLYAILTIIYSSMLHMTR